MFMVLGFLQDGTSQGAITHGVIIIIHEELLRFVAGFPKWRRGGAILSNGVYHQCPFSCIMAVQIGLITREDDLYKLSKHLTLGRPLHPDVRG